MSLDKNSTKRLLLLLSIAIGVLIINGCGRFNITDSYTGKLKSRNGDSGVIKQNLFVTRCNCSDSPLAADIIEKNNVLFIKSIETGVSTCGRSPEKKCASAIQNLGKVKKTDDVFFVKSGPYDYPICSGTVTSGIKNDDLVTFKLNMTGDPCINQMTVVDLSESK